MVSTRRNANLNSSKLRELSEKKKFLVREGRYNKAIKLNMEIENERKRLEEQNE